MKPATLRRRPRCPRDVGPSRPRGAVLAGDAGAGLAGFDVLGDEAALRDWWATRLVAAVDPVLIEVRRRFPFGLRGLWGAVAARVGATAATLDRSLGGCGGAGWGEKHRSKPEADLARGKGYCSTCPLVTEPCLQANLARKLDGALGK